MVNCPEDVECTTTTTTTTTTTEEVTGATEPAYNETAAITQDFVPLKFSAYGISDDADEDVVKKDMKSIFEMILFELEEMDKDSGLKVLDVVAWGRRNLRDQVQRGLQSDWYDIMFNVAVLPLDGVQFGPFIIDGIRERYDSLLQNVKGWTDSEYVTNDFEFDVCAFSEIDMGYNDCVSGVATSGSSSSSSYNTNSGSAGSTTTPYTQSEGSSDSDGGMTMVIKIVISLVAVLLFFCIMSIILFLVCRKDDASFYEPDDYSEDDVLRGKRGRSHSEGEYSEYSKSTAEETGHQLVPYNEQDAGEYFDKCYVDEGEHNSGILPNGSAIPAAMLGEERSVSSKRAPSGASHRSHESARLRSDASGHEVRSVSSRASKSRHSKSHRKHRPDPSVYNIRDDAQDPSVYSNTRRADPSVYNSRAADPSEYNVNATIPEEDDVSSHFSRRFENQLNSLREQKKASGSVRMDYSVVSELSEPSITDHFA